MSAMVLSRLVKVKGERTWISEIPLSPTRDDAFDREVTWCAWQIAHLASSSRYFQTMPVALPFQDTMSSNTQQDNTCTDCAPAAEIASQATTSTTSTAQHGESSSIVETIQPPHPDSLRPSILIEFCDRCRWCVSFVKFTHGFFSPVLLRRKPTLP